MEAVRYREVTEDNVTMKDLFDQVSKLAVRMSRLEVVVVDLISIVMSPEEVDDEEVKFMAEVAARFVTEVATERKEYEELKLAYMFFNSPE